MIAQQEINGPDKKKVTLVAQDARLVVLTTTSYDIFVRSTETPKYPGFRIVGLTIGDMININLENSITSFIFHYTTDLEKPKHRDLSYNIRFVKQIEPNQFLLITHMRTLLSYFLPPMLGGDRQVFSWMKYFINSYLVRNGSGPYIGMLYREVPCNEFNELRFWLKSHSLFAKEIYIDKELPLFMFNIPHKFTSQIQIILDGRYSKLSDDLKQRILTFGGFSVNSDMAQILYRAEARRTKLEQELDAKIPETVDLLDKPSLDNEIISINTYA